MVPGANQVQLVIVVWHLCLITRLGGGAWLSTPLINLSPSQTPSARTGLPPPPPMSPPVVLPSHPSHPRCFPRNTRPPIQLRDARRVGLRKRVDGNLVKPYVAVIRPLAVSCVPSDPECSRPPGASFFFPFSALIRPLAVGCVPSDPECSRPPGALSPRSTFLSDRRAWDGNRRHPPHQSVSQSLSSTVNPFARGQPGCAMRTARVWGIRLPPTTSTSYSHVALNRSHAVSPTTPVSYSHATSQPLPCRIPTLPPNHSRVVFPRYLPTTPVSYSHATSQPLPCRIPTLPPNHSHVAPAPQGGVI